MLNFKQKKCIELMTLGSMTQSEIAKELGVSVSTISIWKKKDEFNTEYVAALKASIKDVAAKAFQTEIGLLGARNEGVRLAAAKDILDRAGFKPDDNLNINIEPVMIVNDLKE